MKNITEITKLDIYDLFSSGLKYDILGDIQQVFYPYNGRLTEIDFLQRLYSLETLPSLDSRFNNARDDIFQHTILNDDYSSGWVFQDERFPLKNGSDEAYLQFLCEIFHPIVRNEDSEWETFLNRINELLRNDGYELYSSQKISNRTVYSWRIYTEKEKKMFVPFSERNQRYIAQKVMALTINMRTRNQIFKTLERYDITFQTTDETGWNYNMSISQCVFDMLSQFYVPKCFNENGEYIETSCMEDFVCKNSPFKVFDIIEAFTYHCDESFISEINMILSLNSIPYKLTADNGIVSAFNLELNMDAVSNVHEKGIEQLLKDSQTYYSKGEKGIAVEKIWDAFERLKSYYYPTLDKKKSCEKIIKEMSHNNPFFDTTFNNEFIALTNLGNTLRIRHHEIGKQEIIDPKYYDYLYNRCLSLIILSIQYL